MKRWVDIQPPADFDNRLSDILLRMNLYMKDVQAGFGAISRGQLPVAGGGDLVVGPYLYLPGRSEGQYARGRVQFDARMLTSAGTFTSNVKGLGIKSVQADGKPVELNLSIEDTAAGKAYYAEREWLFPSFRNQGEIVGLHYFVDEGNPQTISTKQLLACVWEAFDVPSAGICQAKGTARTGTGLSVNAINLLFSDGFPTTTRWPYSLPAPVGGCQPYIYWPALDYTGNATDPASAQTDKTHVLGVLKVPLGSTATPFESGGLVAGGSTRRELYSMPGRAVGDLPIPTNGSVPLFYAAISTTGNFFLDVPPGTGKVVSGIPSTAGMVAGMRLRGTGNTGVGILEDTFIVSVDSATQITMSQAFQSTNAVGLAFVVFGPVWATSLPSSISTTLPVSTKNTTYPITSADGLILADATSAGFTITLPTSVGRTGRSFTIKKIDSTVNAVTLATTSSQTIDGQTTQVMTIQYTSITVVSDGANWVII